MNAWLLLILAGLCEIGWPLGLKWAQSGLWRLPGFIMAGVCMLVSGALLFMAQKHIPIGTAYAVWTGIGAAGTFLAGALLFGDPVQPLRLALDQDGIVQILTSGNYSDLNWDGDYDEEDDKIAGAQALRGYHTLEYLIFKDGEARTIQ